ncbi:2-oxo acid dehydrogenase subunit E2 [Dactylosporangium aurantiacum]|uniref:Dihydrolipoamide acetyltransferase component of pyruvate dehydrogenase complex n=1 Tax=Dactylosporangium aurantiacum TaxID=35754 RepID=A0A9Q9IE85_9ACTN|nr:dihydrolipoamide acetyltransferase family protein [Dactylosporangium aurantiacum]MDG6101760.1 dihydrolipoamide acetyltransferase family protein [Dactylosporangium aurantiacum]UWZ52432.1 2-oxo acid dehydrogenase subunit E2 [Dactylosporangium aurantiacum]
MAARTFLLPDLGEGLTEAEIVRWLVAEGDVVAVDQSIVEVETAKSVVEVPSPYAGRVETLHAAPGATVEVGRPLITVAALDREPATVGAPSAAPAAAPAASPAAAAAAATYREEEQAGSGNVLIGYGTSGGTTSGRRRRPRGGVRPGVSGTRGAAGGAGTPRPVPLVVSPIVRNLARANGLDLRTLEGTGEGGVITRSDVERALTAAASSPASSPAAPPAPVAAGERRVPLNGFRKTVSAALSRSRAEIPEATVWVDVDATRLWQLRERTPGGPGLIAYVARFVVAALREYPVFNARLDTQRQEIVEFDRVDLGIAVQGERGLVVPAVIGADAMTTAQLDTEIRRLTATAREGRSTARELSAGTFTLNNYGAFRVDGSAAIINHPQVAILGLGRIIDRPWVVDGQLCVRKITQMSFVFDHRVCDGGTAAGFMRSVADAIEDPASAIARL